MKSPTLSVLCCILFVYFAYTQLSSRTSYIKVSHGPRPLQERLARAESIYQQSVQERDRQLVKYGNADEMPWFPALGTSNHVTFIVYDFFTASYTCPWEMQRLGKFGDGGKWVCGMSKYVDNKKEKIVIYSFGVNDDSSFEAVMLDQIHNAEVWGYDYSVNHFGPEIPASEMHRAHFAKVGLGGQDSTSTTPPYRTIKSLMDENKHDYIDILKIDIEGAEYKTFDAFMDSYAGKELPIGQILIEIHLPPSQREFNFGKFLKWWQRLEGFGIRTAWAEPNLLAVIYGSLSDPLCNEFVWINTRDSKNVLLEE